MPEIKSDFRDDTTPMPLKVAAEVCFPYGGLTKSALAYAIRRGDLAYEKVGRSYFVTRRDIEKWRNSSRTAAKETKSARYVGFAEARDACLRNAQRLKKGLPIDRASLPNAKD